MDKTPDKENAGFLAKIMAMIRSAGTEVGTHRQSKHTDRNKGRYRYEYIHKSDAKKKRKRKLAYQSKRVNRIRAKA